MALDLRLADTTAAVFAALGGVHVAGVEALGALSTDQFLEVMRSAGELSRVADALGAVASAELTRRVQTDAEFRRVALGGDVGGRFASELARELTRVDDDALRDWERAGDAIAPRVSLQGEVLPCRHEAVAGAILAGTVTAKAAATIASGIDRVAHLADADALAAVEATLVEYSPTVTTRELNRLVRTLPDRLDPDGAEPREDALRAASRVTIRQLPNGLTRMVAELHPEAAGFLLAALDARTAPRRQPSFTDQPDGADPVTEDRRPLAEKRVDALTSIMREAVRTDTGTLAGTAVTMLVTVPLEALQTGLGIAQIAGVDEPISAGTARRLAADAELIPVVLGTGSEVLDLGRGSRLFSEAQRRAMVARDGGCIWFGCPFPPSWCEAAHLQPWDRSGRTDLENGALMCPGHHLRFDRDGWGFVRRDGIPYLIPPPWLDPSQTPRRAGHLVLPAHAA